MKYISRRRIIIIKTGESHTTFSRVYAIMAARAHQRGGPSSIIDPALARLSFPTAAAARFLRLDFYNVSTSVVNTCARDKAGSLSEERADARAQEGLLCATAYRISRVSCSDGYIFRSKAGAAAGVLKL